MDSWVVRKSRFSSHSMVKITVLQYLNSSSTTTLSLDLSLAQDQQTIVKTEISLLEVLDSIQVHKSYVRSTILTLHREAFQTTISCAQCVFRTKILMSMALSSLESHSMDHGPTLVTSITTSRSLSHHRIHQLDLMKAKARSSSREVTSEMISQVFRLDVGLEDQMVRLERVLLRLKDQLSALLSR